MTEPAAAPHGEAVATIDLNADAGESYGAWTMGRDEALFALVSSVNLACGFHAGDPSTIRRALELAQQRGVAVGAHPSYPDLVGFGRRALAASPDEVYADVLYQLGALAALAKAEGLTLHHVKAHGALYLAMMRDEATANAVARAVAAFEAGLSLVVLAGPGGAAARRAAARAGVRTVAEAFPDRGYLADGHLAPRGVAGALLHDPGQVAERALRMAQGEPLAAMDGQEVRLDADTLCLHGDHPEALENARAVRAALESAGIEIRCY